MYAEEKELETLRLEHQSSIQTQQDSHREEKVIFNSCALLWKIMSKLLAHQSAVEKWQYNIFNSCDVGDILIFANLSWEQFLIVGDPQPSPTAETSHQLVSKIRHQNW